MKPDSRFLNQPRQFWANVRSISQHVGYSVRGSGQILAPELTTILKALREMGLGVGHVVDDDGRPTTLGAVLVDYYQHRARTLHEEAEPRLMDAGQAAKAYERVRKETKSKLLATMNKQSGSKRNPAYLTAMVAMLIEANTEGLSCDFDPRELTTVTQDGAPLRTLARRVDGAFPSAKNPIAIWEIKEYYHTTTSGSRVADGVYESMLDGMELEELKRAENVDCKHYLIIDARYTWWDCGRSYLCRIVDMLHMGYVDEVLVGSEVIDRLPEFTKQWVALARAQDT